jgi:hypothetical protein
MRFGPLRLASLGFFEQLCQFERIALGPPLMAEHFLPRIF